MGPGAFSDRGCLLFQVGLAAGALPAYRDGPAVGNVTNVMTSGCSDALIFARVLVPPF